MVYRDSDPSSSGALVTKPLSSYPIQSKRPCPTVCVGLEGRQGAVSLRVHMATSKLVPFFVY